MAINAIAADRRRATAAARAAAGNSGHTRRIHPSGKDKMNLRRYALMKAHTLAHRAEFEAIEARKAKSQKAKNIEKKLTNITAKAKAGVPLKALELGFELSVNEIQKGLSEQDLMQYLIHRDDAQLDYAIDTILNYTILGTPVKKHLETEGSLLRGQNIGWKKRYDSAVRRLHILRGMKLMMFDTFDEVQANLMGMTEQGRMDAREDLEHLYQAIRGRNLNLRSEGFNMKTLEKMIQEELDSLTHQVLIKDMTQDQFIGYILPMDKEQLEELLAPLERAVAAKGEGTVVEKERVEMIQGLKKGLSKKKKKPSAA